MRTTLICFSVLALLSSSIAEAQMGERIYRGIFTGGSGIMDDGNLCVAAALGQPLIGAAAANGQFIRLGFYAKARRLPTLLHPEAGEPARFFLAQNYPNPFNAVTIIDYSLQQAGPVRLKIINLLGQEVTTCVDAVLTAGPHRFVFKADHLSTGVYYYVLESGSLIARRRSLLIR